VASFTTVDRAVDCLRRQNFKELQIFKKPRAVSTTVRVKDAHFGSTKNNPN